MSEKKAESGDLLAVSLRTLLAFMLIVMICAAYVAFVVLPDETENPSPANPFYRIQDSVITSRTDYNTTVTRETATPPAPPQWHITVALENIRDKKLDIVLRITDLEESPISIDQFSAKLTSTQDADQILPSFERETEGIYRIKDISVPDNPDWEVQATVRRGLETMLVAQKIEPLLPYDFAKKPSEKSIP